MPRCCAYYALEGRKECTCILVYIPEYTSHRIVCFLTQPRRGSFVLIQQSRVPLLSLSSGLACRFCLYRAVPCAVFVRIKWSRVPFLSLQSYPVCYLCPYRAVLCAALVIFERSSVSFWSFMNGLVSNTCLCPAILCAVSYLSSVSVCRFCTFGAFLLCRFRLDQATPCAAFILIERPVDRFRPCQVIACDVNVLPLSSGPVRLFVFIERSRVPSLPL